MRSDARRVLEVLPKRVRQVRADDPSGQDASGGVSAAGRVGPLATVDKGSSPGVVRLAGFYSLSGVVRGTGNWVVKRRTSKDRLRRAIAKMAHWCRQHRHDPIGKQHQKLSRKLQGHCGYYGITGNGEALHQFRDAVTRAWRKWLSRRTRGLTMTWDTLNRLLERFPLPAARVVHSVYRVP